MWAASAADPTASAMAVSHAIGGDGGGLCGLLGRVLGGQNQSGNLL